MNVHESIPTPDAILHSLNKIVLGKPRQLRLSLACLLAGGHLLIEDIPGVGKTTLALALARTLGLAYQRIQFTADLLPSDVLGVSIYHRDSETFDFRPGPVFTQIVLADEINRASAKTQSALLEAMQEQQVTVDGITRALPPPFFVIATLNPTEQLGTFPLPESQLDRFLMRIALGYPDEVDERMLLAAADRRVLIEECEPQITTEALCSLQASAHNMHTAPPLLDYILALVHASREDDRIQQGLSPRAGLALRRAAQAWALIEGHSAVLPQDVQAVFTAIAGHRLQPRNGSSKGEQLARELLERVPIP